MFNGQPHRNGGFERHNFARPDRFSRVCATVGTTFSQAVAPPAISGGTLLVLSDGNTVVASDPDRDTIYVVDLPSRTVTQTIALQPGDEPGRLVEDGAGRVHVALRGGGAVATCDPANRQGDCSPAGLRGATRGWPTTRRRIAFTSPVTTVSSSACRRRLAIRFAACSWTTTCATCWSTVTGCWSRASAQPSC